MKKQHDEAIVYNVLQRVYVANMHELVRKTHLSMFCVRRALKSLQAQNRVITNSYGQGASRDYIIQ